MNPQHEALIESLQARLSPIEPLDTMAEAGRKALLTDFVKMLHHETGSRLGDDPEEVHDMRVSIRRMRSTLRLLVDYYKPKAIKPYLDELRKIAQALGGVRDLDVMLGNVHAFQETLEQPDALQPLIDRLDQERAQARKELTRLLDSRGYRRFVKDYSGFLTKAGKGAKPIDPNDMQPFQVRHLLPGLIYAHLGAVRAYEAALADDPDQETLHALRIEFKRLRYAVTIFSDVLGKTIHEFIAELKTIQDHLGNINDIHAAKERLSEIADQLDPEAREALQQYVQRLDEEQQTLTGSVGAIWKHFSTRTVQYQLSNAVASL